MKEINISKNIADLRKRKGITQEQLAGALNISPQAISKWETNTSFPDAQTLPLIAAYFEVSIDYLFYGENYAYNDIYNKVFDKVAEHAQMSMASYEDALKIFAPAHHGISRGNLRGKNTEMHDQPAHISNENGLSLLSGKGYGAIVTRKFFENIDQDTVDFAQKILPVLSEKNNMLVCLAIISMSDISFTEMQEKLNFDESTLRTALNKLIEASIVIEKKSKHKSLGFTYEIYSMYHTCLCILFATLEMQRYSLKGISCCMGYGDYPIQF
ncbi:MAG: helix-turn-helix domain-containing protein [Ruminococcaceae bacterium]|nr:helix-turn-helix domain-containing protein [Oscillospiraceae bacterium]